MGVKNESVHVIYKRKVQGFTRALGENKWFPLHKLVLAISVVDDTRSLTTKREVQEESYTTSYIFCVVRSVFDAFLFVPFSWPKKEMIVSIVLFFSFVVVCCWSRSYA